MEKLTIRDKIIDKSSFDEQNHKIATVVGIKPNFIKDGKIMLELIYDGEFVIRCVHQTKHMKKVVTPRPTISQQEKRQMVNRN